VADHHAGPRRRAGEADERQAVCGLSRFLSRFAYVLAFAVRVGAGVRFFLRLHLESRGVWGGGWWVW